MRITTARVAMNVTRDRQKIVALNHKYFTHIENISGTGFKDAKATLFHLGEVLYVVYDYEPFFVADTCDDSHYGFNKQLMKQHLQLTISVGTAVAEYLSDVDGPLPKVVYTGHGWGGALAVLQSFVVPPTYLVTFGQPPVGNHHCTEYMRQKVSQKSHGSFIYDRYTYLKDPLAKARPFSGYQHIGREMCNHMHINSEQEKVINPSWWYQLVDGFMKGRGQLYLKTTYDVLIGRVR